MKALQYTIILGASVLLSACHISENQPSMWQDTQNIDYIAKAAGTVFQISTDRQMITDFTTFGQIYQAIQNNHQYQVHCETGDYTVNSDKSITFHDCRNLKIETNHVTQPFQQQFNTVYNGTIILDKSDNNTQSGKEIFRFSQFQLENNDMKKIYSGDYETWYWYNQKDLTVQSRNLNIQYIDKLQNKTIYNLTLTNYKKEVFVNNEQYQVYEKGALSSNLDKYRFYVEINTDEPFIYTNQDHYENMQPAYGGMTIRNKNDYNHYIVIATTEVPGLAFYSAWINGAPFFERNVNWQYFTLNS